MTLIEIQGLKTRGTYNYMDWKCTIIQGKDSGISEYTECGTSANQSVQATRKTPAFT